MLTAAPRLTRRPRLTAAALSVGLMIPLLGPSLAQAHMGSTKAVHATMTDAGATLTVSVDAVDAAIALGLPRDPDGVALASHAGLVIGWLGGGLRVEGEAGRCPAVAEAPRRTPKDGKDGADVTVVMHYTCPQPMGAVTLVDDTVFDDDPDHEVFVTMGNTRAGDGAATVLRADRRRTTLNAPADAGATAQAFVREGAVHLVTGYDHLLFLLSLILAAGVLAKRDGLRAALRDVAWVVTAFTVGHSLSLAAASLQWLSLPSRWVEAAIAASIVAVAGCNVLRPDHTVARPWVAAVFGLVHGFGFSSVLAEVGLPAGQRLVALVSFNVGIELAQLAAVAAVLIPLSFVARHKHYRPVVLQGGSAAIACMGCVWLVERLAG